MFVYTRDVGACKRVIATLLAIALVMATYGFYSTRAEAANLTDISLTLSDSAPDASADHDLEFVLPSIASGGSGVAATETIVITYPANFDISGVGDNDIDLLVDGSNVAQSGNWTSGVASQVLTITLDASFSIGAGSSTQILIGNNATNDGVPDSQITNPASSDDPNTSNNINGNESYEILVSAGTPGDLDTGRTRVVILDTVLVTAVVDTVFDFTVTGLGSGVAVNGTTTNIISGSTTIPFGTLTAYEPRTGAQDLQVVTNAANGFVVTVEADGAFRSSTGADIDGFVDGSYTAVPTTWESPLTGLDILNENTWGHWGMTTEDNDTGISGDDGLFPGDEVLSNEWFGVTTTPRVIFAHDGPADNSTPNVGSTTVGYQVEISPLQEAGDDYQTILTYIATPTF